MEHYRATDGHIGECVFGAVVSAALWVFGLNMIDLADYFDKGLHAIILLFAALTGFWTFMSYRAKTKTYDAQTDLFKAEAEEHRHHIRSNEPEEADE
jgi:hypothetical protein